MNVKRLIAFIALIVPCYCYAQSLSWFQVESGVGYARYQAGPDGEWYQRGMPHSLRLNTLAYRYGLQLNMREPDGLLPGWKLHLTYLNLGHEGMTSDAAPDRDTYTSSHGGYYDPSIKACRGACSDLRSFESGGRMQVIALTAEPFWNVGGYRFGLEAGPAAFHVSWTSTATTIYAGSMQFRGPDGTTEVFHADPHWEPGVLVGASIGRGPWDLRYNYVFAKQHNFSGLDNGQPGAYVPAGWRGAHIITINYIF
jgi:hypothetical protein